MIHEFVLILKDFWEVFTDPAHWLFEIVSGGIVALVLVMPFKWVFRRWLKRHDKEVHGHDPQPQVGPSGMDVLVKILEERQSHLRKEAALKNIPTISVTYLTGVADGIRDAIYLLNHGDDQ